MITKTDIQAHRWFHCIDLGPLGWTPGVVSPDMEAQLVRGFPPLTGKTVLDVGAWDGYYSFAAERLGAGVVALDGWVWRDKADWGSKAGFLMAREVLGSRVDDIEMDVLDITPESPGMFDVVLFQGVLYHMRHPLLALERVAAVTQECLVLESHFDCGDQRAPTARFYPGRELNNDPTNWWGPNPTAIEAMLRDVGFRRIREMWRGGGHAGRIQYQAWR